MIQKNNQYNNRLFKSGLRKYLHMSRFNWLKKELGKSSKISLVELGCFDAKILSILESKPIDYLGIDAGWEGGIDEAIKKYPEYNFIKTKTPISLEKIYDYAIALETLEHVDPHVLDDYLDMLKAASPKLLISVPNEIGPVFLCKYLFKLIIGKNRHYSFKEVICQFLGLTKHVNRDEHKGFNHHVLIEKIRTRYTTVKIHHLPVGLPVLSFTIAISASNKD